MEAVAYSTFRKDLRAYLDKTRDDATPLLVTSKDPSANVVVMNAMDYDNLIENLEVQSNARLMSKIERGMKQFAEERGAKRRNTSYIGLCNEILRSRHRRPVCGERLLRCSYFLMVPSALKRGKA